MAPTATSIYGVIALRTPESGFRSRAPTASQSRPLASLPPRPSPPASQSARDAPHSPVPVPTEAAVAISSPLSPLPLLTMAHSSTFSQTSSLPSFLLPPPHCLYPNLHTARSPLQCPRRASRRVSHAIACAPVVRKVAAARRPRVHRVELSELRERAATEWGIDFDPSAKHADHLEILTQSPCSLSDSVAQDTATVPLLVRHRSFLTAEQCHALIRLQAPKTGSTDEADLYLNFRVNREVSQSGDSHSSEAAALIAATGISATSTLDAGSRSGFRAQVDPDTPQVAEVLQKLGELLGFETKERNWVFEEGPWIRPNNRQVVVRDVTTVHYQRDEGVAPHVDGKDLTILICLQQPDRGGDTVFTSQGIAVPPLLGQALLYCSKTSLAHFAAPVEDGTKWVMQLLIDHTVRPDESDVDFTTGQVRATGR